ncbi:MAG: hypothetical protein WCB27_21540 [Thermoguttaceae bacterium]
MKDGRGRQAGWVSYRLSAIGRTINGVAAALHRKPLGTPGGYVVAKLEADR